jgi:multimeric flavodoxin WrbA
MIIPGSSYWNIGIGREIGDMERDEEGMQTMKTLGQNMAWLLKKINGLPLSKTRHTVQLCRMRLS